MEKSKCKCKVVMIPVEKATSHISKKITSDEGVPIGTLQFCKDLKEINKTNKFWESQQIYFISKRKIEIGDLYLSTNNIVDVAIQPIDCDKWRVNKIEATTDKSQKLIPQIPQSFVDKFISKNGNIKKVLIKMKEDDYSHIYS